MLPLSLSASLLDKIIIFPHLGYSPVRVRSDPVPTPSAKECHVIPVLPRGYCGDTLKGVIHGGNLLKHSSLRVV